MTFPLTRPTANPLRTADGTAATRVPGVYFLPPPQAAGFTLPPLDVAAFVGFAERGPLDLPVPLEDPAAYAAVFGGDVALARDRNPGGGDASLITAHLPRAVAAFFANGGRRCYAVRVAGADAAAASFAVPGLVAVSETGDRAPVPVTAASAGTWANALRLATRLEATPLPPARFAVVETNTLDWSAPGDIAPGDLLRLTFAGGDVVLFPVAAVEARGTGRRLTSTAGVFPVDADGSPVTPAVPLTAGTALARVERLRFVLLVREGEGRGQFLLESLAFGPGHARFWGDALLLETSPLKERVSAAARPGGSGRRPDRVFDAYGRSDETLAALSARRWEALTAESSRYGGPETPTIADAALFAARLAPVAPPTGTLYLPDAMAGLLPDGTDGLSGAETAGADGLETFDPAAFLDPAFPRSPAGAAVSGAGLMTEAADRALVRGLRLRGLHSLLFVDEVALVAVPDAVHDGWRRELRMPPLYMTPAPAPPDRSRFAVCGKAETPPPPPPPVPPPTPDLPVTDGPADDVTADDPLLVLHREVTRFCLARRDVLGVLTLPRHFERRLCARWQETLRTSLGLPPRRTVTRDAQDVADLSYVAVFHPWLRTPDRADASARAATPALSLRETPPDGAVCGLIAARERERGVWVAPANVPVAGALGLTPPLSADDWAALFALQFNLIRPEARDFRPMSAHTLSDERQWLQLSVRRMLIQLRKAAYARGAEFVFEPNSEVFRESVRLSLEALLREMFRRGAFAGRTEAESFRVDVGDSVNPPQGVEQGRFVAEVRVAPSEPLEFITVVLLRSGTGELAVTEA